jgi:hypothetical protein
MKRRVVGGVAILALVIALVPASLAGKKDEPKRVTVQHILISFKGKLPRKQIERTKAEAEKLAYEILERARGGEEVEELVEQYTDDRAPGIYTMANRDEPKPPGGFMRENMAIRFGDVAFSLEVGEIGIADYSGSASPYGWHVIKRLE